MHPRNPPPARIAGVKNATRQRDGKTAVYEIRFEDAPDFLIARVTGDGEPNTVAAYYAEACAEAAERGVRKLLVDSHVTKKTLTFDDAEFIGRTVAEAATHHGILAIAVVAHDPESNRDAEQFAVQVFKNIATESKYFYDELAAARTWISNFSV